MHRRTKVLVAGFLALSLIAAACGNSGDDETTDDTTTTTTSAAPTTAAPDGDPDDTTTTDPAPETDRNTFEPIEGIPGVSDTEISVAVLGLREGNPLGTCILDCYTTGIQAYFDYQNSQGGVFGRDLVIGEVLDDQLFLNQDRALEIIANEDSFVAFGATLGASGWGDLNDAGVPLFNWGIQAPELEGRPYLFGHYGASCTTCPGRAIPYQMQLADATKAVSLGYGSSPESRSCASTNAEAVDRFGDELGIELVKVYDDLAFGLGNGVAPEVSEWISLGVDFVAACLDLNGMKTIAQELDRQNYRDQITMQHPNTYDAPFVAEAGAIFDGDFVSPQFVPFEFSDDPQIVLYNEWVDQVDGPTAEQTMIGWINATLFVDGLIATGPLFDRPSLVNTINTTFTAHSANGLINPVDWTRQHVGATPDDRVTNGFVNECFSIVQMQDGEFQTITEQPFLCWPNDDQSWSEPIETTFS